MAQLVHDFETGSMDQKDLLGGKGANLAEMTRLGIPVPPGFTITTDACRAYLAGGAVPPELFDEVDEHLERLEARMGRTLGDGDEPAAGLGALRREVLDARDDGDRPQHRPRRHLGRGAGRARPATPASRGTPTAGWSRCTARPCSTCTATASRTPSRPPRPPRASPPTSTSTPTTCAPSSPTSRRWSRRRPGRRSPRTRASSCAAPWWPSSTRGTPTARSCTAAASRSPPTSAPPSTCRRWPSATAARRPAPASPSPATRRPAPSASTATTCRTPRARTSSPASATPCTWPTSSGIDKKSYDELVDIMARLEGHYRDMCDIEFTIEEGRLWMLQTRVGKRTAQAAFRIAVDLVDEGVITEEEALMRVTGEQLAQLMFPHFDPNGGRPLIAKGMSASPGAAVGVAVFDSDDRGAGRRRGHARHPRAPRDQPRRPARHGRGGRHPDQPWRQDLARGRRGPRDGPHLRLRRRDPRGRHQGHAVQHARRYRRAAGRHPLDRRLDRRDLPRRGPGEPLPGGAATSRAPWPSTRAAPWSPRSTG